MIFYAIHRGCERPIPLRTMEDVAKIVGVSHATVARWFANSGYLYRCTDYDIYRYVVPKGKQHNNNLNSDNNFKKQNDG